MFRHEPSCCSFNTSNMLRCVCSECHEQLDFKDTELQMLVVSLKELTATKEVIQTLEQLLCDDTSQLEEERSQVFT